MSGTKKFSFNRLFLILFFLCLASILIVGLSFVFSPINTLLPDSVFAVLGFIYMLAFMYLLFVPVPLLVLGVVLSVKKTQTKGIHLATIVLLPIALSIAWQFLLQMSEAQSQKHRLESSRDLPVNQIKYR